MSRDAGQLLKTLPEFDIVRPMPPRSGQRGRSSANILLASLLFASLVLHIGLAGVRMPIGPRTGETIQGNPTNSTIEPGVLQVATYNIRRGKGIDGARDLDRIRANLQGFDIVGLNEVAGAPWPWHDQATELGTALRTGWLFAPSQRRWHYDYFGSGLLTDLTPTAWQSLPMLYDEDKGTGHRHIIYGDYAWQGKAFKVMVVHAERGPIRDRQIEFIMGEFERYPRAILLGDLNASASDPVMLRVLSTPGVRSALDAIPRPSGLEDPVDWIIVRGFDVIDVGYLPPGASDHPLVWAHLALSEQ